MKAVDSCLYVLYLLKKNGIKLMKHKNTQTQNSNDKRNVANRIKEIKNHRHNRNTTHYKERLNITKLLHLKKMDDDLTSFTKTKTTRRNS